MRVDIGRFLLGALITIPRIVFRILIENKRITENLSYGFAMFFLDVLMIIITAMAFTIFYSYLKNSLNGKKSKHFSEKDYNLSAGILTVLIIFLIATITWKTSIL